MPKSHELDFETFEKLSIEVIADLRRRQSDEISEVLTVVESIFRETRVFRDLVRDVRGLEDSHDAFVRKVLLVVKQGLSVGKIDLRPRPKVLRVLKRMRGYASKMSQELGAARPGSLADMIDQFERQTYESPLYSNFLPRNPQSALQLFVFLLEQFAATPIPKVRKKEDRIAYGESARMANMALYKFTANHLVHRRILTLSIGMKKHFGRPFDERVADIYPFIHRQVESQEPPDVDGRLVARIREEARIAEHRDDLRSTRRLSTQLHDRVSKVGRVRQNRTKKCRNPG
jgi:hypothetical protein